ncbi:HNH endonuclease [Celeribacter indicus]|uniref:HNH endonuclease domain-containing protein n=1 Tax=Celeribacter indicus TaxID=1208324 RepID=A0A0B5E168_9RHOB|nr:HNH endonuclease signature motif containing protein [Celeribacter indicus]AJE46756.1 HNH endonuclease domain-containing protein [Celeribacter indicus]SDX05674.1 HNH endonuclease [Celeribacter indicus]
MKIGQLVRRSIPAIFHYCETQDPAEFVRLQDPQFSKETFDINYPFCRRIGAIGQADHVRYWTQVHVVHGVAVRVTSQWFNPPTSRSLPLVRSYLDRRGITIELPEAAAIPSSPGSAADARGRYRGNAISNAQNQLVRNILSRLGEERFGAAQWQEVLETFGRSCAYCGAGGELVMDHIVPINRQALGEHRLGNLAPACRACNTRKSERDFRVFLENDPERIAALEAHMAKHGYRPIGATEAFRQIIDSAHRDVRDLADRYVGILNTLLREGAEDRQDDP